MSSNTGPDWSHWPARALGDPDATVMSHRQGTHRVISPDQTWRAAEPLLDHAGITRVADLTWLDDLGIPTVQAVRPASLTLSVSQGKATTFEAARVSAVMESLEGWHCENLTPELLRTATTELASTLTYDPAALSHRRGSLYHGDAKIDWVQATTLRSGRRTWVPWEAAVVNVATRDAWGPPMFSMDTNGLASGNNYDEAALHGLYEIMERHSLATGSPGTTMFDVPVGDVAGAECAWVVDRVLEAGSALQIARIDLWDGYFCFAVELTSPMIGVPFSGSGLHHDPDVALSRAITEAAQSRLTAISGAREDLPSALYHRFAQLHSYAAAHNTSVEMPTASPTPWGITTTDQLPDLLSRAADAVTAVAGTEPLAVVCDFAGACVPVVKVIAPGLSFSIASPMRSSIQEPA